MKRIRIVSPSGKPDAALVEAARMRLIGRGFDVSVGRYACSAYGRFAARKEERVEDVLSAFSDPDTDIVLCSRGGYGLQQIIDRLAAGIEDILSVRGSLPVLVGFSDITCLHSVLSSLSVPSLHGLMAHIGDWDEECESVARWFDTVGGKMPDYTVRRNEYSVEGEASGVLVGGNLSVLYGLQATPWSIVSICDKNQSQGKQTMLFIEDICERHYHIDRMMQNLRLSGVLGKISGLIVGQFTDIEADPLMQCTVERTILQAVEGFDIPVLFGFPAGHSDDVNLPFWLGKETTIKVEEKFSYFAQK